MADWKSIFEVAAQKDTLIFLRAGETGKTLVEDVEQLVDFSNITDFYVYKHYNESYFQFLYEKLGSNSWQEFINSSHQNSTGLSGKAFKPLWTSRIANRSEALAKPMESEIFKQNLKAFRRYFPQIYVEFSSYEPECWFPYLEDNGSVNLVDKSDGSLYYHDSVKDTELSFKDFEKNPNKDGLVLNYTGKKLDSYLHYQYVNQADQLLQNVRESKSQLPKVIKSIILFGLVEGYQLQQLVDSYEVEKLFVCEPNRDFFYASLFSIRWDLLLEKIDEEERRIYLNIGDDGKNIFRDLVQQFYAVGPYNLMNSYFFQTYYNPELEIAIANVREQLQLIISMGEYFDHARYGISQTNEMISEGTRLLISKEQRPISNACASVPVFIIGNGPSLDSCIETIKSYKGKALVISCGTALMPLHKAGIVPDFHAEIEQNRSTFDWCCRVGDFDYLKGIPLISCNGIHPDTAALFKDTLIAFKDGESSTVSALELLGEKNYSLLNHAYPTVSNFVVNIVCELGFQQIYLFGIDLGFIDNKYHHSKSSGYYDGEGKERNDYSEENNTALVIPGNFRARVNTKQEFKISKSIMEQALASYPKTECYNTADGAKISGSVPLRDEMVLVTTDEADKSRALRYINENAFKAYASSNTFKVDYEKRFKTTEIAKEFDALITTVRDTELTIEAVDKLITQQMRTIIDSYASKNSLLFYLLHGTINFTNAFLSKVIAADNGEAYIEEALRLWEKWLTKIALDYSNDPDAFDLIQAFFHFRTTAFYKTQKHTFAEHYDVKLMGFDNAEEYKSVYTHYYSQVATDFEAFEYVVNLPVESNFQVQEKDRLVPIQIGGKLNELLTFSEKFAPKSCNSFWYPWGLPPVELGSETVKAGMAPLSTCMRTRTQFLLNRVRKNFDYSALYILKVMFVETTNEAIFENQSLNDITNQLKDFDAFIEFDSFIVIPFNRDKFECYMVDHRGDRGKRINTPLSAENLVSFITEASYNNLLNK
ncbi:MAG: DUF115 domain-containing protein [Alteromonadaceae bacterium]|nr:DUF115 domain-containing protein [Alteromonadaceae bacterium]